MLSRHQQPIVAIATAPGRGAVGIVRVSGKHLAPLIDALIGRRLKPGGCFPIMVQIPVFIALYWVLLSSVEMRNAPWVGWIHDLSAPDPYFILPLVMTLTTLLQTALNPAPPDPMQAKLMWIMPLVFSVMFFFFPAGLVLYWITNNILSIAQQWVINTRMGVPPQFNLPSFK